MGRSRPGWSTACPRGTTGWRRCSLREDDPPPGSELYNGGSPGRTASCGSLSVKHSTVPSAFAAACSMGLAWAAQAGAPPLRFEVVVAESVGAEAMDGRILLMLSTSDEGEPR